MQKVAGLLKYWFGGIRIYIAFAVFAVTLEAWWWSQTLFGGSQLMVIRLQETYAWLSLGLLAVVLAIGPLMKLFPKIPGKPQIFDSRRAFGLAAAWFAALHASLAYFKQFQAANPLTLPGEYQWSMLLGAVALMILLAMTATSVNAIMRKWGVWWFRLHRLVYVAVLTVLIHAFMIGVHAATGGVLVALGTLALLWIGANLAILIRSSSVEIGRVVSLCVSIVLLACVLTYGLNQHFAEAKTTGQLLEHRH